MEVLTSQSSPQMRMASCLVMPTFTASVTCSADNARNRALGPFAHPPQKARIREGEIIIPFAPDRTPDLNQSRLTEFLPRILASKRK